MSDALERAVGSLEGKMDMSLQILGEIKGSISEHDKRIKSLESSRVWTRGVAAAISFIGGAISSFIFGKGQ